MKAPGTTAAPTLLLAVFLLASCGDEQAPPAPPPAKQKPKPKPQSKRTLITNSIGMKLVLIEPGTFNMGSEKGEDNEAPVHKVTLTQPFYIGVCEVTQAQYEKVMETNPSVFHGPELPVDSVSFYDARDFCDALSQREGATYRLPTEAEWEYACRAGTTTEYPFGDPATDLEAHAWFGKNSGKASHQVGQKLPNPWGLHDMQGNLWEWCDEKYDYYTEEAQTDPQGLAYSRWRVLRGGSWRSAARRCRSAFRGKDTSRSGRKTYGFRVVRAVR